MNSYELFLDSSQKSPRMFLERKHSEEDHWRLEVCLNEMCMEWLSVRLHHTIYDILLYGMFRFFISIRLICGKHLQFWSLPGKMYTLGTHGIKRLKQCNASSLHSKQSPLLSGKSYTWWLDLFLLFVVSQQPDRAHAGVQWDAHDGAHPLKAVIGRTRWVTCSTLLVEERASGFTSTPFPCGRPRAEVQQATVHEG